MLTFNIFCKVLKCDEHFAQQLELQLSKQFFEQVGMDLNQFTLVPETVSQIYLNEGVSYLKTDLVGPDNFGHPVIVAWKTGGPTGTSDALPNNGHLEIWWDYLPINDLQSRYRGLLCP